MWNTLSGLLFKGGLSPSNREGRQHVLHVSIVWVCLLFRALSTNTGPYLGHHNQGQRAAAAISRPGHFGSSISI